VISMRKGAKVAIKSDSDDQIRRLNSEAAKTMRYGGATEDEALKMITINPAWIMGVDDKTGSIDVGKDADMVIWNGYPLSSYGVPEKVFIDGELWFDRTKPGYGLTHGVAVPEGDSSPTKNAMVPAAVSGSAQEVK
jgi:imidazolonepropionase-like amidohydrolase